VLAYIFCIFESPLGPVWDAKFSGDRVITCGEDGTIRIWDGWTNHCINTLLAHRAAVHSIALRQIPGLCSFNAVLLKVVKLSDVW